MKRSHVIAACVVGVVAVIWTRSARQRARDGGDAPLPPAPFRAHVGQALLMFGLSAAATLACLRAWETWAAPGSALAAPSPPAARAPKAGGGGGAASRAGGGAGELLPPSLEEVLMRMDLSDPDF